MIGLDFVCLYLANVLELVYVCLLFMLDLRLVVLRFGCVFRFV